VFGDIQVKPQYDNHEPIVATVTITDVPEGAKLRGSFSVSDASYLPAGQDTFHIWAGPGKHVVSSQGVWVLTKDVTVEGQVLPILIDFGQYQYSKEFVVGEGDDPDPPPIPGTRNAVILEETDQRTPAQGVLWDQLRREFQPNRLLILDDDLPTAQKYLPLSKLTQRPVLLVLTDKGTLVREVLCPASAADVKKEIGR
jgi:hypothetical protein